MFNKDQIRKILSNSIGYVCILFFFLLTTYIIFIFYLKIAPNVLEQHDYGKFFFHFLFGNWLAVNIYFNYTMAWLTSPGLARDYQNLARKYPTCKKCSLFKPPRTHHCSWCNLCILRFDHHCPWLNNCIGFYNHRYFYQFCCFMTMGCLYAGTFGYREYQISLFNEQIFRHIDAFLMAPDILDTMGVMGFITYYIFMIGFVMGLLLFILSWWHGRLIGRGETSVERILNQNYIDRYYQKGIVFCKTNEIRRVDNWKRFLGVRNWREFMQRILLPSTHKPKGNGILMDDFEINTKSIIPKNYSDQSSSYNLYPLDDHHRIPNDYLVNKYQSQVSSSQQPSISSSFISCNKSAIPLKNDL